MNHTQLKPAVEIQVLNTAFEPAAVTPQRRARLAERLTGAGNELAQVFPAMITNAESDAEVTFLRSLLLPPPATTAGAPPSPAHSANPVNGAETPES